MTNNLVVRRATISDASAIAQFNTDMAMETENLRLAPEKISAGVQNMINHPERGFYLVIESDDQIVASLMVTTEWSDWRNGTFWWIQSVYVVPNWRRKGLYSALYNKVRELALEAENVCGFRLYVEQDNTSAQATYSSLGMHCTHYKMFEEMVQETSV